jgi:hypothetical protein
MTTLQVGQSGVCFGRNRRFCLLSELSRLALGVTQPSVQWTYMVLSQVVKHVGHELTHSSMSTAKIKNG